MNPHVRGVVVEDHARVDLEKQLHLEADVRPGREPRLDLAAELRERLREGLREEDDAGEVDRRARRRARCETAGRRGARRGRSARGRRPAPRRRISPLRSRAGWRSAAGSPSPPPGGRRGRPRAIASNWALIQAPARASSSSGRSLQMRRWYQASSAKEATSAPTTAASSQPSVRSGPSSAAPARRASSGRAVRASSASPARAAAQSSHGPTRSSRGVAAWNCCGNIRGIGYPASRRKALRPG